MNLIYNNKSKLVEKVFTNNQGLNTKETLDLMESSWGEKFTKMIKDSVNKGIQKLDLFLKPKNLGKINVEISLKEKQTFIQINAENQEAANILNDNLKLLT